MVICQKKNGKSNKAVELDNTALFNKKQMEVYEKAMAGKNLFLTGSGGVGKSFTLNTIISALRRNKKNVLVTGSTGVASQGLKGITLHKALGLPADVCFTEKKGEHVVHAPKNLVNADVLVIDEISMVRRDVWDSVYLSVQKANIKRAAMGKDPIQLIVSGDFAQLPPVITEEDRQRLEYYYGRDIKGGYAFQSEYWDDCEFEYCELTDVVRQSNLEDVKHLNDLRFGKSDTYMYFNNTMSHGKPFDNAVSLFSYNRDVERRNREELAKLPEPSYSFDAIMRGLTTKAEVEEATYNYNLTVKIGAKVMINANPSANAEFYEFLHEYDENSLSIFANGTIGRIDAVHVNPKDPSEDYIIVRVEKGEGENYHCYWIKFRRKVYELYEYKTSKSGKLGKYVKGTFLQFPLRLCWGMTIHKSQGCTFDYVNIDPRNFSHGQLYVALSRCRSIKNIHLEDYIKPEDIIFDQDVLDFYDKMRQKKEAEMVENLFYMYEE